jgi:hypothetical protein
MVIERTASQMPAGQLRNRRDGLAGGRPRRARRGVGATRSEAPDVVDIASCASAPVIAEPVIAKGWVCAAATDGPIVGLHAADATLDGWHMFDGNSRHDGPVESRL